MSYRIYSGDKKSLVFPIMGDGYVHLDYSKHIPHDPTDSEEPYGLWGHKSSFTIEGIITPYDVNGFGWSLGGDYETGAGNAGANVTVEANYMHLPFNNKYFSAVGSENGATASSRSSAYFSHMHVAYLANTFSDSTCDLTNGDATVTCDASSQIFVGMSVTCSVSGFPAGATVLSINSGSEGTNVTSFELSANFTGTTASNQTLTFTGIGANNTVIHVTRLEDLDGGDYIRIDNEKMRIVSTVRNFGNGYQVTVARGYDGTTATTHAVNAPIYTDNRKNHKMSLFYNANCEFYLKNMTRATMNQPAEYKIGCVLKGKDKNGNLKTVTVESNNPVITADKEYYGVTIEQPTLINSTFGKPIYLNKEDVVKYHKIIDDSSNQIYFERLFNGVDTIADVSSNNVTFSASANTIVRASGSWTSSMRFIKVVGSDNNDGYYKISSQSGSTLTLDTTDWVAAGGTNTSTNLLTNETHDVGALKVYYTVRANSTYGILSFADGSYNYNADGTNVVDMADRVWRGRKLYGQVNSTKTFSTSLEQKEPISLGYIDNVYSHSSGNKVVYVYMAACKLIKPVRLNTDVTFYVDDARDLSVGDELRFFNEIITITAINGNTLTVTRETLDIDGNAPFTSKIDAFGGGDTTPTDYYIDPLEEYNFSRTLYKVLPSDLFNGLKLVDGSGNTISNSDNYGGHLLGETWKEASYVLRPFHLAMSYDANGKRISLMVDGKEVETSIFSEGELTISNIVDATSGSGTSTTVTITTNGEHGLQSRDWISIDGASDSNLDGVWMVTVTSTNTFTITTDTAVNVENNSTGTLKDVTTRTLNTISEFEFDPSDCYLGSNGNATLETRRASQFMGEIHEFAISKGSKNNFQSLDTLIPNYRQNLLYFRFEGENS